MIDKPQTNYIFCQQNDDWQQDLNQDQNTATKSTEPELKLPALYKVIILNDDYTPMDFVVEILEQFFYMTNEKATRIMLQVHTEGRGVCGVYTKDVAETKCSQVNAYARQNDHPLLCEIESQDL